MMLPKKENHKDVANYNRYRENSELCERCGDTAHDVHHIIAKGMGGGRRDDRDSNLIALCRPCHSQAHGVDSKLMKNILLDIKAGK
jgi:5-methylcytosine-specific restriction endonuclease McrA